MFPSVTRASRGIAFQTVEYTACNRLARISERTNIPPPQGELETHVVARGRRRIFGRRFSEIGLRSQATPLVT